MQITNLTVLEPIMRCLKISCFRALVAINFVSFLDYNFKKCNKGTVVELHFLKNDSLNSGNLSTTEKNLCSKIKRCKNHATVIASTT